MDTEELNNLKGLYESIMKGENEGVITLYEKLKKPLLYPLTPRHDSILHVAIYMGNESLVRKILTKFGDHQLDLLTARNKVGDTILHEAAATNMTSLVEYLLGLAPGLLLRTNDHGETPLFRAAHYGQAKMFSLLANEVKTNVDLPQYLQTKDKTTVLHMTVLAEFFDLALEIAEKYDFLASIEDKNGMKPLQLLSSIPSAFKSGSNYGLLKRFIYYGIPGEDTRNEEDSNRGYTHESDQGSKPPPNYVKVCVQCFSMVVCKFFSGLPIMKRIYKEKRSHESAFKLARFLIQKDLTWMNISSCEDPGKIKLWKEEVEQKDVSCTQSGGSTEQVEGGHDSQQGESSKTAPPKPTEGTSSSSPTGGGNELGGIGRGNEGTTPEKKNHTTLTPLLLATSTGIVEIVKEILRVYPQAVDHVSYEGQNILHVAIKHRQLEIFHLVKKKFDIPMTMLVRRIDSKGYSILHQVGHKQGDAGGRTTLDMTIGATQGGHKEDRSRGTQAGHKQDTISRATQGYAGGPALQLQEELHWLERVRKIIPPHYQLHRSNEEDQETADELFQKTHAELIKEAQEWLMRTSESCSTVSVLIATVAFAAAYTVPGGSNQETGVPVLLCDPFFLAFTVMDILSLASSLTSVVMFLSILTSPFQLQDFRHSLPRKLILGFTFLFFSVAVTMLAFAATIVLVIHLKKRWTTTLLYTVAFLPVTVFALLQFPLYYAFKSTFKFCRKLIKNVLPSCLLPRRFCKTNTPSINYKTL